MSLKEKKINKKPLFSWKFFLYDFVKITGGLPAWVWIKPRITYISKDAKEQMKHIGGIVIANHTGVTDPVKLHFALWNRRFYMLAFKGNIWAEKM